MISDDHAAMKMGWMFHWVQGPIRARQSLCMALLMAQITGVVWLAIIHLAVPQIVDFAVSHGIVLTFG